MLRKRFFARAAYNDTLVYIVRKDFAIMLDLKPSIIANLRPERALIEYIVLRFSTVKDTASTQSNKNA